MLRTVRRGSPVDPRYPGGPGRSCYWSLVITGAVPAAARPAEVIVLPGATSAEGIAAGRGATFYAGDLFPGDIFRGMSAAGPPSGSSTSPPAAMAVGMAAHHAPQPAVRRRWLHRPGLCVQHPDRRDRGQLPVRRPRDRHDQRRDGHQGGAPGSPTPSGPALFRAGHRAGVPGPPVPFTSGPAADTSGEFNLNGIQATANGKTLIVAHSANGQLYTVDPRTGASATIAGVSVPQVDGIVLKGRRLWAVQNTNQVTRIRLDGHLRSGVVQEVITSELFQVPATAARFGRRLAVVNAKFDTGIPPTADQYEIVLVKA